MDDFNLINALGEEDIHGSANGHNYIFKAVNTISFIITIGVSITDSINLRCLPLSTIRAGCRFDIPPYTSQDEEPSAIYIYMDTLCEFVDSRNDEDIKVGNIFCRLNGIMLGEDRGGCAMAYGQYCPITDCEVINSPIDSKNNSDLNNLVGTVNGAWMKDTIDFNKTAEKKTSIIIIGIRDIISRFSLFPDGISIRIWTL